MGSLRDLNELVDFLVQEADGKPVSMRRMNELAKSLRVDYGDSIPRTLESIEKRTSWAVR